MSGIPDPVLAMTARSLYKPTGYNQRLKEAKIRTIFEQIKFQAEAISANTVLLGIIHCVV